MLVGPNSTLRVANSESVSISLDAESEPSAVRVVPRIGEPYETALQEGGFVFPALDAPNHATVKWLDSEGATVAESYAEVVSRHYFPLDALRSYGDGRDDFDEVPDAMLWEARQAATDVFEQAARRSFVKRLGRTKDYGRDDLRTLAHNDVETLLTDGYVLVSDCQCERSHDAVPVPYPVWVEYVYGADSMSAQVSRAVLELAAYMLRPSNRPVGATGESTDAGYIHFTTAGRDGATDIPEVNVAIEQFGRGVHYVW